MIVRNKQEIIYYLGNKHNKSLKEIEQIVTYQFKFVSQVMALGNFDTIRIPYFGKFSVNKNRVKYITELANKNGRRKES